jgi:uncharacterized membrane protein
MAPETADEIIEEQVRMAGCLDHIDKTVVGAVSIVVVAGAALAQLGVGDVDGTGKTILFEDHGNILPWHESRAN